MARSTSRNGLLLVATIAVALTVAFAMTMRGVTAVGSTRTDGHAIPLQGATSARLDLTLDSGELRLGRGSSRLLDAAFTYNVDDWEPEITYRVISREGVLELEQGETSGPFPVIYGDTVNIWDVLVSPDVPVDVRVDLGTADGTLVAGGLDLLGLIVSGDGGDAVVDLSGPVARDLDVHLATGGGTLTLTVPTEVGVRVVVMDSGSIDAGGLQPNGAAFVNDRYGSTPLTVTVTVNTDGGDLTLLQAPAASPDRSAAREPVS